MAAGALLFDLDGTLWDSHPVYERALGPGSEGTAARLRSGDNLVRLVRSSGLSDRAFASACARLAPDALYPDVTETLQTLSRRGLALGVVTNLPAWLASPVIQAAGLDVFFGVVTTAAGKPGVRGLRDAIEEISADGTLFFVGDGTADAVASATLGIAFAWASYGYLNDAPATTAVVLEAFPDVLVL